MSSQPVPGSPDVPGVPEGSGGRRVRLSDAEREAVADFLREQAGEGRLSMTELEERLEGAYAARYDTDLAGLTHDLPAPAVEQSDSRPSGAVVAHHEGEDGTPGKSFAGHIRVYLVFSVFFVAIWALSGFGYFWPVWPMLGWGLGVAAHWASSRD